MAFCRVEIDSFRRLSNPHPHKRTLVDENVVPSKRYFRTEFGKRYWAFAMPDPWVVLFKPRGICTWQDINRSCGETWSCVGVNRARK